MGSVKDFQKRRYARLLSRLDEDDGRWITTEKGHRVHLNESGEPDLGNRHVLEKMQSGEDRAAGSSGRSSVSRIKADRLPPVFSRGSGKKVVKSFNSYLPKVELPKNISDMFENSDAIINGRSGDVFDPNNTINVRAAGIGQQHQIVVYQRKSSGLVGQVDLHVPDVNAVSEEDRWIAAGIYAHEWLHYVNLCASNGSGYSSYSDSDAALTDSISAAGLSPNNISDKIKEVLVRDRSDGLEAHREVVKKYRAMEQDAIDSYHSGKASADAVNKQLKKMRSERKKELEIATRRAGGGAAAFSGLYDALMYGRGMESKICLFGHSTNYFWRNSNRVKDEALASYVQLYFSPNKEYLRMFREDQPEIARELDKCIEGMANSRK